VLKLIRLELARSKDFPTGYRAGLIVGRLIAVLIVTNLVAMTLDSVPALQAQYGPLFTAIELLSLVLFTIEYGLRVWVAAEHAPHRPSSERKALRPLRSSLD
jgi:voltage-gated potassium channel